MRIELLFVQFVTVAVHRAKTSPSARRLTAANALCTKTLIFSVAMVSR
jgi:hypothetical protein